MTNRRHSRNLSARRYAWLSALFVAALAVSVAHQFYQLGPRTGETPALQPRAATPASRTSANDGAAPEGTPTRIVATVQAERQGLLVGDPDGPLASLADEPGLALRALSASDPDDRLKAIHVLSGSTSRQALSALGQVAASDQIMRNRFVAVDSLRLRALGQGHDDDGDIHALLVAATADVDPAVASKARDALAEIEELVSSAP